MLMNWQGQQWLSGVQGNERADELARKAVVGDQMTLDSPLVLATVKNDMCS